MNDNFLECKGQRKTTDDTSTSVLKKFDKRRGLYAIGIILLLSHCMPAHAQQIARQCFVDAKMAYQHLIQQQQVLNKKIPDNRNQSTPYMQHMEASSSLASQTQRSNAQIQKININRASEAELIQLTGVGSKRAQDIVLYREMMGGFVTVNDLANIKGIGTKTIEKNRHRLSVTD